MLFCPAGQTGPVGGSGCGFARSVGLRPHSHAKPPPHFVGPAFATQTLIRAAKTSYTAGTLCDIGAKIWWKIIKKYILKP
jgi:hypothetical protein